MRHSRARWALRRRVLTRLPWGYWSGFYKAGGHKGAMGVPGSVPETLRQRVRRVVHNATAI